MNSPDISPETRIKFWVNEEKTDHTSPYYNGLLYTEKGLGSGYSPYYKGLVDRAPARTSPNHGYQAEKDVRLSLKKGFSFRMHRFFKATCFSFNEKTPTMIKVYSTERSNEKFLRERGSEPPLPPPLPLLRSSEAIEHVPKSQQPLPAKRSVRTEKEKGKSKEEKKYFWADKYRPMALKDFICNKDKAEELQKTVKEDECHHFIFEGEEGVGKRTMIWALLREVFGPDKVQARDECKTFHLKGEEISSIIVNVKESHQHVEVNLSELKGFEKHVIVELIKETDKLTNKTERCSSKNCRAIILLEADKLSTDALLYIRWVVERHRGCHKIFFCCQDASKLQPLMNICKLVQLYSPSNKEIVEVLEYIAIKEKIELPRKLVEQIATNSKNNLRQAIRSFEATCQYNSMLEDDQVILTGWEDDIADIAKSIVAKQSPKELYGIRRKLQNLINHNVPPSFIFDTLSAELKNNVDESLHTQIENTSKEYNVYGFKDYERYANDERKLLIHEILSVEEFIARFMSCYKSYLANKARDMTESEKGPL